MFNVKKKTRQTQLTASLLGEWGFFKREGQQKTHELPLFSQVNIK